MYRFCALLISLLSLFAHAEVNVNGYAYYTAFSDHRWYDDRSMAAVNIDWHAAETGLAIRSQVSTYSQQHLRRAVVEYAAPMGDRFEGVAQVGRFSRLDSFYNGVTDSPADYGMAMMPGAGYSYRMINGAFALLDGVQGQVTYKGDAYLLRGRLAYGAVPIPSQPDILYEAFKRQVSGAELKGTPDSYDWSLHYETDKWHGYVGRNAYNFETVLTDRSFALARTADAQYHQIHYRVDKAGLRYEAEKWWSQVEWFHDFTERQIKATSLWAPSGNSVGQSVILGYRPWDKWSAYIGRSYGRNKVTLGAQNEDNFVGATYDAATYVVSIERHEGSGFAWRKYSAPFVTSPAVPEWQSWVVSATYRF